MSKTGYIRVSTEHQETARQREGIEIAKAQAKKEHQAEQFPKDLSAAFEAGKRLAEKL